MKKITLAILVCLLASFSVLNAQENLPLDTLMQRAAQSYASGDYNASAAYYESILAQHGQSYELYYNLGNAYFKAKQYPQAILNYERALLLNPRDEDLRFNLELCQSHVVDKIEVLGDILFVRWYKSLQSLASSNTWAILALGGFVIFLFCLSLYFFGKTSVIKKISFSLGIISIVLLSFSLVNAGDLYLDYHQPDQAIVFAPSVTVKSSPDQSGTDLFLLHEGTKVQIKSRLSSWVEIKLADGSVGWMPESCLEII